MIQMPDGRIQVQSGDTLWSIAQKYLGNGARWQELGGFGGDPRRMPIGTVISLPGYQAPQATPQTTPTAPAGPKPLTPEEIAAKEEEAKYNTLLGEYDNLQEDWKYLIDPTDLEGKALMQGYLDKLTNNSYLDPYYEQRVADGVAGPTTDSVLQTMLADPELVKRYGVKWLEALATTFEGANKDDFNYSSAAHARDFIGQAGDLAETTMTGLEKTSADFGANNIKGGMRNAAIDKVETQGARAAANMNANESDWRRKYKAGNAVSGVGYAQAYRNDISKNDFADLWSNSGINNASLQDKFLTTASTNWTT